MILLNRALAVLLVLLAAGLVWIGGQLLLAGGSAYYVIAAAMLVGTAVLLWRQSARAVHVFALLWLGTLVWSLWEAGPNGWALAGRLGLLTGVGLWLLLPWVRRSLGLAGASPLSKALLT